MQGMIHSQMMDRQQYPVPEILLEEEKVERRVARKFEQKSLQLLMKVR